MTHKFVIIAVLVNLTAVAVVILWLSWPIPLVVPPRCLELPHKAVCKDCGRESVYGEVFDDLDYKLLADVIEPGWPRGFVLDWQAPHGPGLTCNSASRWAEMPFARLGKELQGLQQDTYDSFIARNRTIAVHQRKSFTTRNGSTVRIAGPGSRNVSSQIYTRAGFNKDLTQALIYREGGCGCYELWERKDGRWVCILTFMTWIT